MENSLGSAGGGTIHCPPHTVRRQSLNCETLSNQVTFVAYHANSNNARTFR